MIIPRNTRTHTQKKGGAALHFVFVFRRCITLKVDEWIRFECVYAASVEYFDADGWMDEWIGDSRVRVGLAYHIDVVGR